jgi:formate-dependent nitrite reductase membrane component NrfD
LGHPFGSVRAVLKVKTSWLSRGIILLSLFGIAGFMNMVWIYFAPGLNFVLLKYIVAALCILVAIYAGMLLSYIKALQLWNTGMLPLSFVVAALWGGSEMLLGINILTAQSTHHLELWIRILLPSFAVIVLLYLVSIWYSSPTGAASVKRIVAGDLAVKFYLGVVIIGLIFPIAVVLSNIIGSTGLVPELLFLAAIVCGLIGDMTMRYCIMKGALYKPLI